MLHIEHGLYASNTNKKGDISKSEIYFAGQVQKADQTY